MLRRHVLASGTAAVLCSATSSAWAQDPGLPSGLPVTTQIYEDPNEEVLSVTNISGIEERAEVYYPSTLGAGPYPLVLFMHGKHPSCYENADPTEGLYKWPCSAGVETTVPSYQGYREVGEILASHGFIVVSISANGINGKDGLTFDNGILARAELYQHHLDKWQQFNTVGGAPFGTQFVNQVDLANVGIMGHSRGGEAAVRHYLLNQELGSPYKIRAVMPIAPTDDSGYVISGVPLASLVPYCDGDVHPLYGVTYYDDARYADPLDITSKFYFLALGANHNFFNTIWTPEEFAAASKDDAKGAFGGDPHCDIDIAGNGRLSPAEQRLVGNAYIAGFFRVFLNDESEFLPQLRGDVPPPASIGDAVVYHTYHPGYLERLDVNRLDESTNTETNSLSGAVAGAGLDPFTMCGGSLDSCMSGGRNPHFGTTQMSLGWDDETASYQNELPAGFQDLTRFDVLQFRAAVRRADVRNEPGQNQDFSVILTDGMGSSHPVTVSAFTDSLYYPPGGAPGLDVNTPAVVLNAVRIPLTAFDGFVSLDNITSIEFGFNQQSSGGLLVSDIALSSTVNRTPSDIVMVLDTSGSMSAEDFDDGNQDTRLDTAVKAARFFAASLDPDVGHRLAVLSYNSLAQERLDFVDVNANFDPEDTDPDSAGGQFSAALDELVADGTTSIGAGVEQALSMLPDLATSGRRPAILLLTDGRQNTAPCLAIGDGVGGLDTGQCDAGGDPDNLLTVTDPRLAGTSVCSVGMGRAEGQVDEEILERFSTRYLDAQSNAADYNGTMAAFSKCAPEFGPDGIAIDPSGVLARGDVAAPVFNYGSCGDRKLSFVSGWHRSLPEAGEVRLLVTSPSGQLVRPAALSQGSRSRDWDIQRVTLPEAGDWRFQIVRRHTRITNGFASDAFVDHEAGVGLVRRQLQRLCPDGCGQALYFEDGRADASDPSVYADALLEEGFYGTGLIGNVTSYDASQSAEFAAALAAKNYDLLIYVRQLDDDALVVEDYDFELLTTLCNSTVPAILTDTRAASAFVLEGNPIGLFHECSGVVVAPDHTNFGQVLDADGKSTLVEGSHALTNRGYPTFSYSVGAVDFDRLAVERENNGYLRVGATQLEGGSNVTFSAELGDLGETTFGSIATFSADQPYWAGEGDSPIDRFEEQWSADVRFEGMAPLIPRVRYDSDTEQLAVSVLAEGNLPASAAASVAAWTEVVRPTQDLAQVASTFGCTGSSSPNGDIVFGSTSVAPEDIPVAREAHALNDSGVSGDVSAADGVLSATIPANVQGTYALTYYMEFEYVDAAGGSCTVHREGRLTQYVGAELLGNGAACTPSNPDGGFPTAIDLGDDPAKCPAGTNVIVGTSGSDVLKGTSGSDCILGLGGNDFIEGFDGNDLISGGAGKDRIDGGRGDDVIFGGAGRDELKGGKGNDTLFGGPDDDQLYGGTGHDQLFGGEGDDVIDGGSGRDVLDGGSGADLLLGYDGDDTLIGGTGSDKCKGGEGNNQCIVCEVEIDCGVVSEPECTSDSDCPGGVCVAGVCEEPPTGCDEGSALDLGAPGNTVSVGNDACLMVRDEYPEWWGSSRQMKLETTDNGTYPVPFDWTNQCSGGGGSGLFSSDWQAQFLPAIDSSCATVITLLGDGSGSVGLRYWAE